MSEFVTPSHLELIGVEHIPMVNAGDDLAQILVDAVEKSATSLRDRDVLVVAQKVVSKSENRLVPLQSVQPSSRAKKIAANMDRDARVIELVLSESIEIVRQTERLLITENKLGMVMANAGVDLSNVEPETALLLPEDPDRSAQQLKSNLKRLLDVDMAVVVADSVGRAWRMGIIGHAIGVAGLPALVDLRNTPDLFGHELRVTEIALADAIAAAANLLMGQGNEGRPFVIVRGFDAFATTSDATSLIRPLAQDLFR